MKFYMTLLMVMSIGLAMAEPDASLRGKVTDKTTDQPIPGVSVFIPELNRGVVTDIDGNFRIAEVPERTLTLQFSFLGYGTIITKAHPGSDVSINIQMEETTTTVDEVVVSGAYIMSQASSPISIEKINKDDILKMPSPSLMSALTRTPGVNEISLGPGISKPVIRGLSFSRVLSVYQGARFENQQWGADHGLGLTETGIAGVEIIKGPASLIYGSGAMAGVVQLLEERDASAGQIEGDINLRGYSNSLGGRAELGVKGTGQSGFLWSLRGASESHADYMDGDGNTIGNTRFSTQNIKATVGMQKKWGDTKLRYTFLKQKLGILAEDELDELVTTRNDRSMQLPFQHVNDHFMSSETNVFLGDDRLKLTLGYHWNFREEIEEDVDLIDLGLRQQNFMYDLKYFKSITSHMEAIIGVQGFYLQNTNYDSAQDILIPDASKDDRSLFGLLNYAKNSWVVQGGLRYDYRKVHADASGPKFLEYGFELSGSPESRMMERSFDGITASGGTTFRPNDNWRFRFNLASGFRAPDLAELFSNGPHPGTSRFEMGNADFVREQNIQSDFGIRYRTKDYSINAEVFYNHVNNYLFFSPTDQMEGDLTVWQFEQSDARLYGGESMLEIHPENLKWFGAMTSYSMVVGQRRSDNTFLPYIPAFRWNQELTVRSGNLGNGKIFQPYATLTGALIFDQNRAAPLEDVTQGYYLLGVNVGGSFNVSGQKIDAYISGSNLLNLTYLDHLSLFRPFGVHQTGRNIALNVRMSF